MSSTGELSYREKLISATFGGVITALITTPLEVIKTRLQTVPNAPPVVLPTASGLRNSFAAHLNLKTSTRKHPSALPTSFLSSFSSVIRTGGIRSLWSGLLPSIIAQVPSTSFYFMAYEELKARIEQGDNGISTAYAPLVAGILARTVATTLVSPLDLLRTKAMYYGGGILPTKAGPRIPSSAKPTRVSMLEIVRNEISAGGVLSLWRGLVPMLWRDVPFSGLYWLGYEKSKSVLTPYFHSSERSSYSRAWVVAFISGFLSGSFAAIVTHPLDVVKTRRQVQLYSESSSMTEPKKIITAHCHRPTYMRQTPKLLNPRHYVPRGSVVCVPPEKIPTTVIDILRAISKSEGISGLFAGMTPRLVRVGPACAIMISSYELGKVYFGHVNKVTSL